MGQIREQASDVLVLFLLDVGTFVERLLLYCFDITALIELDECFQNFNIDTVITLVEHNIFNSFPIQQNFRNLQSTQCTRFYFL